MASRVRPDSPVPIYEQIVTQLIYSVANGDPPPGELVPSVRELAQRLLVHPNTVAKAFQELERAGVIETRRGRGMAVTEGGPELARQRRKEVVRARVRDALGEAADAKLTSEEVHQLVSEEWAALAGETARRSSHD